MFVSPDLRKGIALFGHKGVQWYPYRYLEGIALSATWLAFSTTRWLTRSFNRSFITRCRSGLLLLLLHASSSNKLYNSVLSIISARCKDCESVVMLFGRQFQGLLFGCLFVFV
jgi:hypothetical protein